MFGTSQFSLFQDIVKLGEGETNLFLLYKEKRAIMKVMAR